ncbi:MAG: DUF2155 domain-containing protein [Caenispirillum bisanense]|nr:DUF2155 domain-containing protein [Caenispirillum bisanense]MCA1975112.1 DUF2155 domain-containing protein [Caenispirillum sp.]
MRTATAPLALATLAALAAGLTLGGPAAAQSAIAPDDFVPTRYAVLRALDKQMGRVREIPVTVGETARFYGLRVTVRACRTTPVSTTPHQAAFVEIRDDSSWGETVQTVGDGPDAPVFSGWMFADSPSLSGLEHPVYDIWVKECTDESALSASAPGTEGGTGVQEAMVLPTRKPDRP